MVLATGPPTFRNHLVLFRVGGYLNPCGFTVNSGHRRDFWSGVTEAKLAVVYTSKPKAFKVIKPQSLVQKMKRIWSCWKTLLTEVGTDGIM